MIHVIQRFVTVTGIVCLGAVCGCASRTSSQGVPSPSTPSQPPVAVIAPSVPSELAPSEPLPAGDSADCGVIADPGEPVATVALTERVDPANAPYPVNESERLLFRQLYETLVRMDCTGRVLPGLAESWRLAADGSTWILTLRQGARFSDGTPLTSAAVVAGWSIGGGGNELRPKVRRLVRSIVAVDDQTLEVTLPSQRTDVPVALAHTDLAIARHVAGSQWPLGTRPFRIAPNTEPARSTSTSVVTLIRLPEEPAPSNAGGVLTMRFVVAPGSDARDLLDQGIDLLLTRDPTSLAYAATLPQFVSVPLEWQRTHILLTPGMRLSGSLSEEARDALARDAVRAEARGALGPFWWESLPDCEIVRSQSQGSLPSTTGSIVYDAGDNVARDLAERLVGLVRTSGPGATAILDVLLPDRPRRTYERAIGLIGTGLAAALRRGNDAGYILALDSRPLDPCREMQVLVENIAWAGAETIVPLVDTRLQAIVRRGRSGISAEWDGGLLMAADGRDKR